MKKLLIAMILCAMILTAIPFCVSADPAVPTASVYGYQKRFNYTDMAMDYRVVGTLTLADGYTLADIADIGFAMVLSDGSKQATPSVSGEMVYTAIQGGGITYHAGSGEDTATDIYIGGDYLFLVVIQAAPGELDAQITPYVNYGGEAHNGEQSVVKLIDNANAPKTLSDGTKVKLIPVTDGVFPENTAAVGKFATDFTGTTQSIFDNGATIDLNNFKGMLIKITPNMETSGMNFRFQFKLANGTTVDSKSAARTFYWFDGENWTSTTKTAQHFTMPNKVVGYAYFEFTFGEAGTNFPEVTSSEIANLKIYKPASETRVGSFSEWYLVQAVPES